MSPIDPNPDIPRDPRPVHPLYCECGEGFAVLQRNDTAPSVILFWWRGGCADFCPHCGRKLAIQEAGGKAYRPGEVDPTLAAATTRTTMSYRRCRH